MSPFKGQKGAHNYFKDVIFAMMRTQLGGLDLAADRYMNVMTTPAYLKFAKDSGFAPESITLPSGALAHWIGNKTAKKVILYFHGTLRYGCTRIELTVGDKGGGYVTPCTPGHFQYLKAMKDDRNAQGSDVAVLVLAYDLAPEHPYPTQLRQSIECLRHLVETERRSPADISLGGDSAGGNLAIGVLSHLAHPHPDIPALTLPGKLHAALLISPWCSFNTHTPSYETNAERDCFDARPLQRWSTAFLGSDSPFAGDFYNEPVTAPASWWEGTADVIEEVLIWAGGNEILLDGIEEFSKRFTKGFGGKGGRVNTAITAKAAHIEMILELLLGYKGDSGTGSAEVVNGWVKAKL